MYLKNDGHTYYRGTEQCRSRGAFLILFSWNDYRAADEQRAACPVCQRLKSTRDAGIDGWTADPLGRPELRDAYDWPAACPAHTGVHSGQPKPVYSNGKPKLWAAVRSVAMAQCGNFMMGRARIGGQTISISGSCGADGLPRDYQDVPIAARARLVEVPEDVAAVYWSDNGHNTIGSAAPTVRSWAVSTFLEGGK